ncbi:MAG TPA: hypothetical protein VMY18_03230 [Acidobacteriota bacterium]|nr:hypothetical protein [Acidobacteriota bacterium]
MNMKTIRHMFRNVSGLTRVFLSLGLLCFLMMATAQAQEMQLYFPQFVTGGGYFSQVTIVNPNSGESKVVTLKLADEMGIPLANVEFTMNGGSGTFQAHTDTAGELPWPVQPFGTLVMQTKATGGQILGSAVVTAPVEIDGVILFGGNFGLAGVQSSDEFSHGFMGPVEIQGSAVKTAIALQNLENSAVSLTLELLNQKGERLALSDPINIPSKGRVAKFIDELFAGSGVDFSFFLGSVRLVSDDDVAAMMLQTRPNQLATLPVTELPRVDP